MILRSHKIIPPYYEVIPGDREIVFPASKTVSPLCKILLSGSAYLFLY